MYSSAFQMAVRGAAPSTGLPLAAGATAKHQGPTIQSRTLACAAFRLGNNAETNLTSLQGGDLRARQSAAATTRGLVVNFKSQEQPEPQAATADAMSGLQAEPQAAAAAATTAAQSSSSCAVLNSLPSSTASKSACEVANPDSFATTAGSSIAEHGGSGSSSSNNSSNNSAREQAQLLKQLLQLRSVSSVDSLDGGDMLPTQQEAQQMLSSEKLQQQAITTSQQQQQQQPQPQLRSPTPLSLPLKTQATSARREGSLYDDASAEDYDPMLLDMMGFTSVAQYLQYKLDLAVRQAKVDLFHAAVWMSLGAGFINAMGGYTAYSHYVRQVTERGVAPDNLAFVWVFVLGYYTVKTGVMGLATSWRAWQARAAEPGMLQQLEAQIEKQHQRLAYWMLQERLLRYDNRANRCYTEFALASLLLGVLMLMQGGVDDLQLQLETVNQHALSGSLVMMVLFWESYFSSISAVVQVVQLGSAWVNKVRHRQKWDRD